MPFDGSSGEIFEAILRTTGAAVAAEPEISAGLEAVIGKALEKDRDLRYQTRGRMRADLKRLKRDHSAGRSVPAGSSSSSPPQSRRLGPRSSNPARRLPAPRYSSPKPGATRLA